MEKASFAQIVGAEELVSRFLSKFGFFTLFKILWFFRIEFSMVSLTVSAKTMDDNQTKSLITNPVCAKKLQTLGGLVCSFVLVCEIGVLV